MSVYNPWFKLEGSYMREKLCSYKCAHILWTDCLPCYRNEATGPLRMLNFLKIEIESENQPHHSMESSHTTSTK